jgi:hypothetical protein
MIFLFFVIPKVLQIFPKKRDMKLVEFTPPEKLKKQKLTPNFIGFKNENKFICKKLCLRVF